MLRRDKALCASLRYRRPYWMLFLHDVDNWKIYTVIHQPEHQRTEMLYQAWLGGLDRPYVRPKCMAHQPVWLTKKRHMLQKARLDGPETALEKYVLEWHKKFHSYGGTERPTADDLHTAFDLVERPLDLSYACQLLSQCQNDFNIRLARMSFLIFLEACLRVDRKDCARYSLEHAEQLGFWHVDDDCRRYLAGEQTWYKLSPLDNLYYPLEENAALNAGRTPTSEPTATGPAPPSASDVKEQLDGSAAITGDTTPPAATTAHDATQGATPVAGSAEDDEIARLQAELEALEAAMSDTASSNEPSHK